MKKRLFTALLTAILLVGAVTGVFLSSNAENSQAAFDPDTYDYDALYVKEGLISWFNPLSAKEGDTVNPVLPDSSGNDNSFTLAKINSAYETAWTYGNGYLQFGTGSNLTLSGIFDVPTAADASKTYTLEYIFSTLDEAPQASVHNGTFEEYAVPYRQNTVAYNIGGWKLSVDYINRENRATLKSMADAYQAAKNNSALQSTYSLTLPSGNAADQTAYDANGNGVLDYTEVEKLLSEKVNTYYPLTMNYDVCMQSGIGKTTFSLNGKWQADYDWKGTSKTVLRISEGDSSKWHLKLVMTGTGAATGTTATLYNNGTLVDTKTREGTANADIILGNDLATRVYGIRIYDRALTDAEITQNHLADICKFYKLDPSFYTDAPDSLKALYEVSLASIKIGATSTEEINEIIGNATKDIIETEKNEYTELYVQDGLLIFANTLTSVHNRETGSPVLGIIDTNGNTYTVSGTATWTGTGINMGIGSFINFGNVLPADSTYSVHFLYAHSNATQGTTSAASYPLAYIGPARYNLVYSTPADTIAPGGITKSALFVTDGVTGKTSWKIDYENHWGSGNQHSDLFSSPYGTFNEFGTNMVFAGNNITVTPLKEGAAVTGSTVAAGELTPTTLQFGPYFDKDFYGVAVYDHVLTDEEYLQNHFANLMAYYKVDMTEFNTITDEETKLRLYSELATVRVGETTTKDLQETVNNYALTGGELGTINPKDYITFAGVQSRIKHYAAARGLFSMNLAALQELEAQGNRVDYGVLMAEAVEGRTPQDLTMTLNSGIGEYVPSNDFITAFGAYRQGEFTKGHVKVEDGKAYFAATLPRVELDSLDSAALNREYLMRAYIAIDTGVTSFILYVDIDSPLFGQSVSISEAATYFLYSGFADSPVLSTLCGEYATAAAQATLNTFKTAEAAYLNANHNIKLIESAHLGATTAYESFASAAATFSGRVTLANAIKYGPQLASDKAQSLIYAQEGLTMYTNADEQIGVAHTYAAQIGDIAYDAAIAAGADKSAAEKIRTESSASFLGQIMRIKDYLTEITDLKASFNTVLNAYTTDNTMTLVSQTVNAANSLSINGTAITDHIIITDNDGLPAAQSLQKLLLKRFGYAPALYNIENVYIGNVYDYSAEYAILLGITENELQVEENKQFYSVYGEGKNILIEGNTLASLEAGAISLVKDIAGDTGALQITLDRGDHAYLNSLYTPLVQFNHADEYGVLTYSSFDVNSVWSLFQQRVAELPDELDVIEEKNPEDYTAGMKLQYFVSTTGNDTNAGTKDAPFATLKKALDAIAFEGGGVIWLRGGTYIINETPTVTADHSGSLISPTFIAAYPGEQVTFTSAHSVDGSSLQTIDQAIASGLISASVKERLNKLTPDNHKNVYVTRLTSDHTIDTKATAFLYVDNKAYHVARYPNANAYDEDLRIDQGRIPFTNTADGTSNDIRKVGAVSTASSSLYANHKNETGGWEAYYDNTSYAYRLDSYDLSDTQLYTFAAVYQEWHRAHYALTLHTDSQNGRKYMKSASASTWGAMESSGNNLYFYNVIEELDAENEYYIDQANRLMYIWTENSLADAEILYCSNSLELLTVSGASHVVVDGIHFTKTNTTALKVTSGNTVIIQNCKFDDIKGAGISMTNGEKCGLLDCELTNLTASSTVSGKTSVLKPMLNFVQNCYFHDYNELTDTSMYIGGMSTIVSHNLFKNLKIGISGAYECILEYNEFDSGSQITYDSGPIYMSMPANRRANHIRYNLLHNLNVSRYGIYLDDVSSGNYVYCNIIEYAEENTGGGKCVNIHSGTQNVVYNNIGLRASTAGILDAPNYYAKTVDGVSTNGGGLGYRWVAMATDAESGHTGRVNAWGEEAFKARYPMLYQYGVMMLQHNAERNARVDWNSDNKFTGVDDLELFLREPFFNVYKNNVMIDCGSTGLRATGISEVGMKTAIFEKNLAYQATVTDLKFVDEENDNYNFQSDSVVFEDIQDFKSIPFDRIGRIQDLQIAE